MDTAGRKRNHMVDAGAQLVGERGLIAAPVRMPISDRWVPKPDSRVNLQVLEGQVEHYRPATDVTQPTIPLKHRHLRRNLVWAVDVLSSLKD